MTSALLDATEEMHVGGWQVQTPKAGEALVRVQATGICAGDMYIDQGRNS